MNTNYIEIFESITTVKDLYQFREELQQEAEKYRAVINSGNFDFDNISKCNEANFFLQRVESRIQYLESKGVSLDKIEVQEQSE